MQVTALAEVVMAARRADGAISLHDLQIRLCRAGLEELARAVASLRLRPHFGVQDGQVQSGKTPWM